MTKQEIRLNALEQKLNAQITKINSMASTSLGIGTMNSDISEQLTANDNVYPGAQARLFYRGLNIIQRIIDSPADDAVKNGFKIKTNYDDEIGLGELLQERFEDFEYKKLLRRYLIHYGLYSRGALMVPIIQDSDADMNRSHYSNPINYDSIDKIDKFNLIHEEWFFYRVQSWDPLAKDYGEALEMNVSGQAIHPSRYYLSVQFLDPMRQRGISTIDRILTACKGINVASWTITNLLLRYRALLVKYPAQEALNQTAKNFSALQQLIDDIKMRFTSKSVAAVPSNYEFEYLQTTFAGIKEANDFQFEFLSAVSRIPQSIIKGSASGELASAQADKRDYHDFVKSEYQIGQIEQIVLWMSQLMMAEKKGKIRDKLSSMGINRESVRIELEFEPLMSPDPMQKAQIEYLDTQRLAIEIDKKISTVEQAEKIRYPHRDIEEAAGMDLDSLVEEMTNMTKNLQDNHPDAPFNPPMPDLEFKMSR